MPRRRRRLEGVYRCPLGEPSLGLGVVAAMEQVGDRSADRLPGAQPEDALGRRVPFLDAIVGRNRDDGLAGGGDGLFEQLLRVRNLAVQAGTSARESPSFGE